MNTLSLNSDVCLDILNASKDLLGISLLFNLEHLKLSLSVSSLELVLSLQSSQVGLSGSFLGSGSLGLLSGLSLEELLLSLLGLGLFGSLFLLKELELLSVDLLLFLLILALFLSLDNRLLIRFHLVNLLEVLLLLFGNLLLQFLLLFLVLLLKLLHGRGLCERLLATLLLGSEHLLVSLLGSLLKSLLHGLQLLELRVALLLRGGWNSSVSSSWGLSDLWLSGSISRDISLSQMDLLRGCLLIHGNSLGESKQKEDCVFHFL